MRITVGIATSGRAQIVQRAIDYLRAQTHPPDSLFLCSPAKPDLIAGWDESAVFPIHYVPSELGLTKQRNAIIRAATDCDVLLFIDDDFFMCRDYIAEIAKAFETPEIVVATGLVLADGIKGPGLSPERAEQIIARENPREKPFETQRIRHGYGCNMALRYRTLVENALTFDENLPRYGWYEDVDLMRRLGHYGVAVRCTAARGVHLGVKIGRSSGKFFGYSQIANPVYLHKKGTYDQREAVMSIVKNFSANVVRSIYPEPYVDRRGRLLGNLLGLRDLATRRLHPMNALRVDT